MRKFYLFFALLFIISSTTLTSCGDKEENLIENPGTDPDDDNKDEDNKDEDNKDEGQDKQMSSYEQKIFLEETGIEFVNSIKSTDFEELVNLANYASDEYSEYDTEELEEWADECFESMLKYLGKEEESDDYSIYRYTNYSCLYVLSNFKGHFEAKNGQWVYSKANDLQFAFKDQYGKKCTMNLTVAGKTKKVYIGREEDWFDYEYDDETGKYIEYIDVYQNYLEIPEVIELTLTVNDSKMANVKLTTSLDIDGEEFNIERDNYSASLSFSVADYSINVDKFSYNAQKDASVAISLKKGSKLLAKASAYVEGYYRNEEIGAAKNAEIVFDILEKVKVKGECMDILRLADKVEKAEEYCDNEKTFKSYLSDINEMLDLNVYYNNSNTVQASVRIDASCEDEWGEEYWYFEPVICFGDGTSYNTFDVFFDENDFEDLIRSFENLIEDFEWLLR